MTPLSGVTASTGSLFAPRPTETAGSIASSSPSIFTSSSSAPSSSSSTIA